MSPAAEHVAAGVQVILSWDDHFRSLLSVVHHIQVVIVIAKDGVAVVNGHAAQGVGVARCAPNLAASRAVKAVAVAGAFWRGVEVQVVGAGAIAITTMEL